MHRLRLFVVAMAAVLMMVGLAPGVGAAPQTFVVRLTAAEGACPALDSEAHGVAIFQLQDDGSLTYRLVVGNIEGVTAAHIHAGGLGQTGGVLVGLPPTDADSGLLAQGTIPAGQVSTFLTRLETGQAYVNVHTTACPAGEVRGQITPTSAN